jgi:hypothetical protein
MVAVKAVATVVAARSNAATRVLTTVVMAKAVPHREVHVRRAVAPTVVAKSVANTMATSCHATSTP